MISYQYTLPLNYDQNYMIVLYHKKKKKACDLSFPLKRILFCIDQLEVCPFLKTILINPKHLPQEF